MSVKNTLKHAVVAAAGIAAFFGPTIAVENRAVDITPTAQVETLEGIVQAEQYSVPTIIIKKNTAKASGNNIEGRMAVLGFDIVFNALKCGIGAYSNGDDFWPAFGKGALSGIVVYAGKEIASHNDMPFLGATGKFVHDLGVSMSDNVTFDRPMFSRYVTDFGPIEIQFGSEGTNFYIHPYSLFGIVANIAESNKFEIKDTIYNATPVFSFEVPMETQLRGGYLGGFTIQNVMAYCRNCQLSNDDKIAKSHEMNHVLFNSEFRWLDYAIGKKSDIIEDIPIIWPLAPVFDYMKFGPCLAERLFLLPLTFSEDAYHWLPHELEAYTMQDPPTPNSHPFYK